MTVRATLAGLVLLLAACAPAADPLPTTCPYDACDPSATPLDVVVRDAVTRDEVNGPSPDPLVLASTTAGPSGFLSRRQIRGELGASSLDDVGGLGRRLETAERASTTVVVLADVLRLAELLEAANTRSYPVTLSRPVEGVVVGDLEGLDRYRNWISPWAPAVTIDRALVRFSLGWTPHGATGTYLLERCPELGWHVVWMKFSFYA